MRSLRRESSYIVQTPKSYSMNTTAASLCWSMTGPEAGINSNATRIAMTERGQDRSQTVTTPTLESAEWGLSPRLAPSALSEVEATAHGSYHRWNYWSRGWRLGRVKKVSRTLTLLRTHIMKIWGSPRKTLCKWRMWSTTSTVKSRTSTS